MSMAPSIPRPALWSEDLEDSLEDDARGCVPEWPTVPDGSSGCGTIALNLAMGIGIWKGPTENDRLIEALEKALEVPMADLTDRDRSNLLRHMLYGMDWKPSGLEGDDPELQPLVDRLVEELRASGRMRQLVEEWLLSQRRGW